MPGIAKAFEGLGNILNVGLGIAAFAGGLFFSVPFYIVSVTMLMALLIFVFSSLSFHIDSFDISKVRDEDRDDAVYQLKFLLSARSGFRTVLPAMFALILAGSILWTQAPTLIASGAKEVVREELARPTINEAIRYVAPPAVAVVTPPQEAGAPVVAPEPSINALKSKREIAALPLRYVLTKVLGDATTIFGQWAWNIFLIALILAIVIWFVDRLVFRRYVGPPKAPTPLLTPPA